MSEQLPGEKDGGGRARPLRRALVAMLVLGGMAIAAGAGMYVILLLTVRGEEVVVPNLIRMTQAEAEAEASKRQLLVEVAGRRMEPRVPEGHVFEQDPPPGARTRPQRTIKVLLSEGQGSLTVPYLVGEPLRKVQLTLKQMGLRVGTLAYVPSRDQPADQVLAHRPAAGALRQKGEAVDLLVSQGAPERVYVMPALTGLSAESATAILKDAGVKAGVTRRALPGGAGPGIVLEQHPPEGFPLREHQTVRLVVAR